jgi:hypothetical protein
LSEQNGCVPLQSAKNVPILEFGHDVLRKYITKQRVEELAIRKYQASGNGITFVDVEHLFAVKKSQAQRSLKHLHRRRILFTARDLIRQGINLIPNKSPQAYFPTCIKSDILENLEKRSAPVNPTGINSSKPGLSNTTEFDKANSFLQVLMLLPSAPQVATDVVYPQRLLRGINPAGRSQEQRQSP